MPQSQAAYRAPSHDDLTQLSLDELAHFYGAHADEEDRLALYKALLTRRKSKKRDALLLRLWQENGIGEDPCSQEQASSKEAPPLHLVNNLNVQNSVHVLVEKALAQGAEAGVSQAGPPGGEAGAPSVSVPREPGEPCQDEEAHIAQMENAERVLRAWSALDILAPQSFEMPFSSFYRRVVPIEGNRMPWEGPPPPKGTHVFYQVFLGTLDLPKAYNTLFDVYADDREERPKMKGKSLLAMATLDSQGRVLEVGVSSFAWGLPIAMSGKLLALSQWPKMESLLAGGLESVLGMGKPVTRRSLEEAHAWLMETLELPQEMVSGPIWDVLKETKKQPTPPETDLLPPFFLADLAVAADLARGKQLPLALQAYLGETQPRERFDILHDKVVLKAALSPEHMPLGRWPGRGGHGLVTLQQAAVNLATTTLDGTPVMSVNGPPGTGKTTLLSDIVASAVIARASAMAAFESPEKAFTKTAHSVSYEGGATHIHTLDETLRGHEVLVTSSNNKAVENISAQLPSDGAISQDALEEGYFQTLSNPLAQSGSTWGLISARLGNRRNRRLFMDKFWWDNDTSLRVYLKCAYGGQIQYVEENDVARPAKIITQENAPHGPQEALAAWQTTRRAFLQAQERALRLQGQAVRAKELIVLEAHLKNEHQTLLEQDARLTQELALMQNALEASFDACTQAIGVYETCQSELRDLKERSPGFLARYVLWWKHRSWHDMFEAAHLALSKAKHDLRLCEKASKEAQNQCAGQEKACEVSRKGLGDHRARMGETKENLERLKEDLGGTFIDEAFLALPHEECQMTVPWIDCASAQARDALFGAAMSLHKAFIGAAARPLQNNLSLMMGALSSGKMKDPVHNIYLPHLWSSLFMVVPVLSTTFASVGRMLSYLSPSSIGWLLIDEAGQATPQAAVGSIMRARRVVAVGDPLQIEPVVTLPEALTSSICRTFGINEKLYNAPSSSVQTLCDRASVYGASPDADRKGARIGVPLLVHRRCANPMFQIANDLAYGGLMVHKKARASSAIRDVLGPSAWFDVKSQDCQDKWSLAEGAQVVELLNKLHAAGVAPHLYMITPFVQVKDALQRLILRQHHLKAWLESALDDEPGDEDGEHNRGHNKLLQWCQAHIGTVHTFQGRESEAVILVLGAPLSAHAGARAWAGKKVNLLNVALTRAKEGLYVVGDREKWKKAGVFYALDAGLDSAHPFK
ncbi:MAG: hypothetical protein C0514_02935 [Candidatus Puniceispirillum sp.]|nr:hypothetical protein [Candidatus Puniceispirillum sp.]